jgi:hypothetical protein
MKPQKERRPRQLPGVAKRTRKTCAWRKRCTKRVTATIFCATHQPRAERDYITIWGLNPTEPLPRDVSWTAILYAVQKRARRKHQEAWRMGQLKQACEASGCTATDSIDTGFSCRNCLSRVTSARGRVCAIKGCTTGCLSRDRYCAWHSQCMYTTGFLRCFLCGLYCKQGRLCEGCDARCQYKQSGTVLGVCEEKRVGRLRFCATHDKISTGDAFFRVHNP